MGNPEPPSLVRGLSGGDWIDADRFDAVVDPFRGDVVAHVARSTTGDCGRALDAAVAGAAAMAAMPGYERAALLRRAADLLAARAEGIALAMSRETGKALKDSRLETARSAETLRLCAEEAVRIQGAHVPMDASPIGAGKIAMTLRFPVGVVAAITPFNAPVNLAAHKLGPALAAGNAVVLKPSPKAPLSSHKVVEAFVDAGAPPGSVNTLFGDDVAPALVSDPRVDFVSFTGSTRVGRIIRAAVGMKRVALELGGVGPTVVHGDAALEKAAKACARNAMLLAGQSCISVQNVFVQRRAHEAFVELLLAEIARLEVGDPLDGETDVGTLIDEAAAARVAAMIEGAVRDGARLLRGGARSGALLQPALLDRVHGGMAIVREEIFGPAMTVQPYDEVDAVLAGISDSPYGLQCGIFTGSLDLALRAIRSVRTGGVIVNGTSRWRSDQMPYGGVKDSGIGREGPKYAIEDMTEERFFVFNEG